MVNNKSITIRLTKNQHERIRNIAQAKGYKNVSDYIRSVTLGQDMVFQEKFDKLYERIFNEKELTVTKDKSLSTYI